jgi:alkanesulfonate monooxygenase SsuD/methylene tetrahydromethanopterin reductase-like flavin-dependent oxidoreductase (luciferase family)
MHQAAPSPLPRMVVQTWGTDVRALRRYWHAAERLGYHGIVYGDGLWPWTHDGWTMLGALATLTRRVRIGPAVTYLFGDAFRHPALLAKAAVAVDALSGGRLDLRLGVGAGDPETAAWWRRFDMAYGGAGERIQRLADGIRALRALWSGEEGGRGEAGPALHRARLVPGPVQRPHPPFWVAAMRPRMLRLAAELGDGWEASYLTGEEFSAKGRAIEAACRRAGRDPGTLARSLELDVVTGRTRADVERAARAFCQTRGIRLEDPLIRTVLMGTPAALRDQAARLAAAGATHLTLSFADFPRQAMLRLGAMALVSPEVPRAARDVS